MIAALRGKGCLLFLLYSPLISSASYLVPWSLVRYILQWKGEVREDTGLNPTSALCASHWSSPGLRSFLFKWIGEKLLHPQSFNSTTCEVVICWTLSKWRLVILIHINDGYPIYTVIYCTDLLVTLILFLVYIPIKLGGK